MIAGQIASFRFVLRMLRAVVVFTFHAVVFLNKKKKVWIILLKTPHLIKNL